MDKKRSKLEEPVKVPVTPEGSPDYTPDPLVVKKELYQRDKDHFFADDRLYRMNSEDQKKTLEKFFSEISIPYYNSVGLNDATVIDGMRTRFIEENLGKLNLAKKKEDEEFKEVPIPEFQDRSQVYSQPYSKQDVIKPVIEDYDLYQVYEGFQAQEAKAQETSDKLNKVIPELVSSPDFGYIKSRPEVLMEIRDDEEKKVNAYLKKAGLTPDQRESAWALINHTAEQDFLSKERAKYSAEDLGKLSFASAEPYIKDATPGSFIDPVSGMRKLDPTTSADADQLALIRKYQEQIFNDMVAGSASSPLRGEKDSIDEAQVKLMEQYNQVEEKRRAAVESLAGATINTSSEVDEWKFAQTEFIKSQKDLENKIKSYNDKVDKEKANTGSLNSDVSDKTRLQSVVNDAYLLKNFWDKRYAEVKKSYEDYYRGDGSYQGIGAPSKKTLLNLEKKRADATAYFEAASRMAYNNEGPLDIKKDAKFMLQVLGDAALKSFLGEELTLDDKKTEQEILHKISQIGMKEGMTFTPDELTHMQTSFLEHASSLIGSLVPDLPMLFMAGGLTGAVKTTSPVINKLTKGYKVIRNIALEKEGATIAKETGKAAEEAFSFYKGKAKSIKRMIGFDEAVPTGWEVLREAKPTTIGKIKGLVLSSAIDEVVFSGVAGMQPGMMTGMNTAHLLLPDVQLKGKLGVVIQPFLDAVYKSAVGATAGMEAGAISSSMVNVLMGDSSFKEQMDNLYPNLDDATKRILAEVAINSIFFGAMGIVSKGSQKSMTAPLGAKYGQYNGNTWTAYFDPAFRLKVYEAAKTADQKGYTDTARELYVWLDMTKEPIQGKTLKEQRVFETEEIAKKLPVGVVRMGIDANRQAIKELERLNNDPNFDGYVTLKTRTAKDIKPMDVVEMDGQYYEVESINVDKNNNPIEFSLKNIDTGETTRALTEDVKTDLFYKVGSRLELALRLENHYEKLQTLNQVLADKGFYGEQGALKEGPPAPKSLNPSSGQEFVKPPEPTKIEKRRKQFEQDKAEFESRTGETITLPESLRKKYVFGVPDEFTSMPVGEFSDNIASARILMSKEKDKLQSEIGKIEETLNDTRFQGRLDLETRKEKQELKDEITRIGLRIEAIDDKFNNELSDFYSSAKPNLEEIIKSKGQFSPEEIDDILGNVWKQITAGSSEISEKNIGEIVTSAADEYIKAPAKSPAAPEKPKVETETIKPEVPEGVPDQRPQSWRDRGYRIYEGVKYVRQDPIENIATGSESPVIFSKKDKVSGYFALIERKDLQPSHSSGYENPLHFIPEAQPRNRGSLKALADEARKKSSELDPHQLGFSTNAYTGAPVVNSRGEVIQGNGRGEAIKFYYDTTANDPRGYIKFIRHNSANFGLTPKEVDSFKEPVLVRMIDVEDPEAIRLGNYGMSDIEDVVEGTTQIRKVTNRLNRDQAASLANIALRGGTADDTLNELIRKNSEDLVHKLVNYEIIQQGDAERFFDKNKNIKPEGLAFIDGIMKGMLFRDGSTQLPDIFSMLPIMIQRGIEKSIPILMRLSADTDITGTVQNVIMGLHEFDVFRTTTGETKSRVNAWAYQGDMLNPMPAERYSKLELAMIDNIMNADSQKSIVSLFRQYEDLVKGVSASLYEEAKTAVSKAEALKKLFGEDYEVSIEDQLISKNDEETEVPAGRTDKGGNKPGAEGTGGKETVAPKDQEISPVDVSKDLKDMKDLLGFLGDEESQGMGIDQPSREAPDKIKVQLGQVAMKIIEKFTGSGVTDFPAIMKFIIPQMDLPTLKKLLPYLKTGYTGYYSVAPDAISAKMEPQLRSVKQFGLESLDALISEILAPNKPIDDFKDIIGKTFYLADKNMTFKVLRVEQWDDPRDQKIELMEGGLFGEMPKEFEPMLVAVIQNDPKSAIRLDQLRKAIELGKAVEKPEYKNETRAKEFESIAKEFEQIGERDTAEGIRNRIKIEPVPGRSLEDEMAHLSALYQQKKVVHQIKYGDVWFEKAKFIPLTEESYFASIDGMHEGDPLETYIRANITPEQLERAIKIDQRRNAFMSLIGFTWDSLEGIDYLRNKFLNITATSSLLAIGETAKRIETGDKRTKPERLERLKQSLPEIFKEAEDNMKTLIEFIFRWRIKYYLNSGTEIRDAKHLKIIANDYGVADPTTIRESVELALVELSDRIAKNEVMSIPDRFNRILDLYQRFPKLDVFVTSDVREKQQYSTPVPIAYLMGEYVNSHVVRRILDPSAGNGALLIGSNQKGVRANDIDPIREKNLIQQGYRTTNFDASQSLRDKFDVLEFDALLTNPPFSVAVTGKFPGDFTFSGTHLMVANALENLADHGKAAIIIGSHTEFDASERIKGKDLQFFNWLEHYYNVEDVINIPGEFYSKMGTSYPVRLILINGRKAFPEGWAKLKSEKDNPVNSWTEFLERIETQITSPDEKSILQSEVDAIGGTGALVRSRNASVPKDTESIGPLAPGKGEISPASDKGGTEGEKPADNELPGSRPGMEPSVPSGSDNELSPDDKPDRVPESPDLRQPRNSGEIQPGTTPADVSGGENLKRPERIKRTVGLTNREQAEVVSYAPLSRLPGGNTMVPGTMANEIEESLNQLKGEIGDIDNYVMGRLRYNSLKDLSSAFYAEQVDAIGMSVFNIENGESVIVGDMTGVGKGRVAAGVIAYAVENNLLPIFITKSANLFTDIYRDLINIGRGHYAPFIVNKDYQGERVQIFYPNSSKVLHSSKDNDIDYMMKTGEMPVGKQVILTTYSQFNTDKGNARMRRKFFENIASRAVFILDESHEASGESNTGEFFREFIAKTKGGIFLSATFAKRPDNLPVYAVKSVLREANLSYEGLVSAITSGGPALQEIISSQLAESMQFIRRQLNMENTERNWYILGDDDPQSYFFNPALNEQLKRDFDGVTLIMHEIIDFQRIHIRPIIEAMNNKLKKEGQSVDITRGTKAMGVSNTPYFSKVFNIVDQLLLAVKVKHVIPFIVEELKAGRKPVIALKSTMEAMISDLGLEFNQEISSDFRYVLKRGLDGIMRYTVKYPNGNTEVKVFDLSDLTQSGFESYKALNEKIKSISTGISISPIDVLIKGITDAGYKVAEITGRHTRFELSEDMTRGKYIPNKRPGKNELIQHFNNEPGWAAILNVSGSTGISMHSSPDFKDTSQRVMFIVQNDLDANVVVQIQGRVFRSDQLNKPIFNNVISVLPAEKRLAMMNARKLKSLYANTSSNQKSSKTITDAPDFLNKYGDQVVVEYLKDNPDINSMLNNPVDLTKDSPEKTGAAHKVTGRVAVLPIDLQEKFYQEVLERYDSLMQYLDDTQMNDLEVGSEPLNALPVSSEVIIAGKGGFSAFGDDSVLETFEVDILRKPLTRKELTDLFERTLEGKDPEKYSQDFLLKIKNGIDQVIARRIADLRESYDSRVSLKKKEAEGKEGSAEEIEYWLQDQLDIMESHLDDMIKSVENGQAEIKKQLTRLIGFFYPGRVLEVPFDDLTNLSLVRLNKGIFVGFEINEKRNNPFVLSNIYLRFATADSRRLFRIPASNNQYLDSIIANSYSLGLDEAEEVKTNWDKLKPSRNREKRYIITGNILQAMATYKGRLIEFTMQDGTVRKGILMSEGWENPNEGKVVIPASRAINIIKALAPKDFVQSVSGSIQIMRDRPAYDAPEVVYFLRVPLSRSRGEKFYSDPGLKQFIYEGIFTKVGDWMSGRFGESKLEDLLKYLESKFGESFSVSTKKITANETSQGAAINLIREMESTTKRINMQGRIRPEAEVMGAQSKIDMGARIKPEPITGERPKKIWQIENDFAKTIGQKIFWDRPARKGMAGSYTPALGKLVIEKMFSNKLDIVAHELGHRLDDVFGLVGPEAQSQFPIFQKELRELWQFGSEPPSGHPNALQYRMKEGVAEYFRAFIVNPAETLKRYPSFSRWFEQRVKRAGSNIWKGIEQFSIDVRTFYGAKGLDVIGSNIKFGLEGQEKIPWGWTSLFRPTTGAGDFKITMFDFFSVKMLNSMRAVEKAYRWGMGTKGKNLADANDVPFSENFIYTSHLLMGYMSKLENMFNYGLTDSHLRRYVDPVTKQPISLPWKYEALPDASLAEMENFRQEAVQYMVAERIIEAIWKFGAKQVRYDLTHFTHQLPPMSILKKYPHIMDAFSNKIESILKLIETGKISDVDVFLPLDRYDFDNALIIGVAQEGQTDKQIAEKALSEFKELKEKDPKKAAMYSEYARRYRMLSIHAIKYAHEKGLITDDLYDLIMHEDLFYIALHRYFSAIGPKDDHSAVRGFDDLFGVGKDSRGFEGKIHINPLKGSTKAIVDPDLIQLEAIADLIVNADKNEVLRDYVLAFTSTREPYDEELTDLANIGYIVKSAGPHTLAFFVNGLVRYFKVQDPFVYKGLTNITATASLPDVMTLLPRLLRNSITHSPAFLLKNIQRDFINSLMIAEVKFKPSDLGSLAKNPWGESMLNMYDLAGGGQFGFYIKDKTNYYRLQREWMFKHSKDPKKFFTDFKTFVNSKWDDLSEFMSGSEKVTRTAMAKAAYNKMVKEGMDPYEALIKSVFEARDLLDFHVAGEWMKVINQFIVFSNAGIRGIEKVVKTARDRPVNLLTSWALMAVMPAIANSLMISTMDDDTIEEYKQLPPYQRDMFFNIPLGSGRWLTIPKPFELGYLSSAVQRIADKHILNDSQGLNEDWYRLGYNMLFPFDFVGITGGYAGVVHAITNRDFFRNKWIIPPDEMDTAIITRNIERATVIGKSIQKASVVFSGKGEPVFDARKVDDFITAQIPYYGTYFLKASEMISGGAAERSMRFNFSDLGVVKESPVYAAEDVQWVLSTAKSYKLTHKPAVELLNSALRVYYLPEIQADRDKMLKVGKDVRTIASIIRKQWDRPEINFGQQYQEYAKLKGR